MQTTSLYHHGIKGQKWGVKNGPPYPLSTNNKRNKQSEHIDKNKKNKYNKSIYIGKTGEVCINSDMLYTSIGILAPALILAGRFAVSNMLKRHTERKQAANINSKEDLPKKKRQGTIESDMKAVNPNYTNDGTNNGYTQNCMYCTAIYDLRRRGFDVTAHSRGDGGRDGEIKQWYQDAKIERYGNNREKMLKSLLAQGEGARGYISAGSSKYLFAHAIAYEVRKGNVEIIDAQLNKKWSPEEFANTFDCQFAAARLDNIEPNWQKIGETISPDSLNKERR